MINFSDNDGNWYLFKGSDVKAVIDGKRVDISYCIVYLNEGVKFDVFMKASELIRIIIDDELMSN